MTLQIGRAWALLFARLILGLIFGMAGVWKVFTLGPLEHARRLFVEPYAETWLPTWGLWSLGTVIPVVELLAGGMVLIGWRVRPALIALGGVLVIVTFGHLVAEPLYDFTAHVIPRTGLLLFLLAFPVEADRYGLDHWLRNRARDGSAVK